MAGKIQVIVGGQFGSEGKGHCAAELARREHDMMAIRTGGPNAGHTAWGLPRFPIHPRQDPTRSIEFKFRQLPVAAVVNSRAVVALAARSLVQLDLADSEAKQAGTPALLVDRAATVLEPAHTLVESTDAALSWGSTQKGIGAARMDRLHRTARTFADVEHGVRHSRLAGCDVAGLARKILRNGGTVQIEAAQGYGLGLHTEFYPKTTSADCRAIDALADVGLSPWEFSDCPLEIWLVVRPNPIRVAGESGPLENETTWSDLGLPEERTTVTNKVRRVGGWDPGLVAEAVRANGGNRNVRLWMNMADHVFPFLRGATELAVLSQSERRRVSSWVAELARETNAPVCALGTGPDTAVFLGDA